MRREASVGKEDLTPTLHSSRSLPLLPHPPPHASQWEGSAGGLESRCRENLGGHPPPTPCRPGNLQSPTTGGDCMVLL